MMSTTPTVLVMDPELAKRLDAIVLRLQKLDRERAQLILQAREQGASLREIAAHAGMTHVGIKKLIGRHLHPTLLEEMDRELPDDEETKPAHADRRRREARERERRTDQ